MSGARPIVLHQDDCAVEGWSDASRRLVRWRTLFSAGRTPTASLTLGVAELPPGQDGPLVLHRHEPVELYYVLAGEGQVWIGDEAHPVRPGSAVFVPGGVEHGARNTGSETLRILYVFAADSFEEVEYRFSPPRSIE